MFKQVWVLVTVFFLLYPLPSNAETTMFQAQENDLFSMGLINNGQILLSPCYWIQEEKLSFVFCTKDGRWGFYDKSSGYLHPAEFDCVYDMLATDSSYPVLVEKDGYFGYVQRTNGSVAIPLVYQSCGDYSEFEYGYAIVGKQPFTQAGGSGFVLIDPSGSEILFENNAEPYALTNDGYVFLRDIESGLCGFGTVDGTTIVSPAFDALWGGSEGYLSYCIDDKWGHMDLCGNIIIPPTYKIYSDEDTGVGYSFVEGIASMKILTDNGEILDISIDYKGNRVGR